MSLKHPWKRGCLKALHPNFNFERQKSASFIIDQVMEKLQTSGRSI